MPQDCGLPQRPSNTAVLALEAWFLIYLLEADELFQAGVLYRRGSRFEVSGPKVRRRLASQDAASADVLLFARASAVLGAQGLILLDLLGGECFVQAGSLPERETICR